MPLINAGRLVGYLREYRFAHLQGKLGGGKSSLAVRLGLFLAEQGYRFVSNLKCIFNEDINEMTLGDDGMLHACIIPDEGGAYFKTAEQVEIMSMYAGKMDIIYLIPSFVPPHRSARIFRIQPLYSYYSIGLPLIAYKWTVKLEEVVDQGVFFWAFPEEIYGVYSRQFPGTSALELLQYVETQTQAFERFHDTYAAATIALDKQISRYSAQSAGTQSDPELFNALRDLEETRWQNQRFADLLDETAERSDELTSLLIRANDRTKKTRRGRR